MPQLNKGDTFADGQQVTGARLNQLVDNATLIPGAITDQTAVAANDIQSVDQLLVYDNSAVGLRKASVSDVLNASLVGTFSDVVTDDVSAKAGNDVLLTPNSKPVVTGKSYISSVSSEVTTIEVAHIAHDLSVGSFVSIANATNSLLNGTHRVSGVPTVDSFQYEVYGSTTGGFGTLDYTKLASVRNEGNLNVNGSGSVVGDLVVDGNGVYNGTGSLKIPTGTTAQRPGALSTGMIRYNTQTGGVEFYDGSDWNIIPTKPKAASFFYKIADNTNYSYDTGGHVNVWAPVPLNNIVESDPFVVNSSSFTGSGSGVTSITLPAGKYSIQTEAHFQAWYSQWGLILCRVYNNTALQEIGRGTNSMAVGLSDGTGSNAVSTVRAVFTLTTESSISVQVKVSAGGMKGNAIWNDLETESLFQTLITKLS